VFSQIFIVYLSLIWDIFSLNDFGALKWLCLSGAAGEIPHAIQEGPEGSEDQEEEQVQAHGHSFHHHL